MTSAHFANLATVIAVEVTRARTRIDVAVAWFTDSVLLHTLVEQAQAKVHVCVVVRGDGINFNASDPERIDWQPLLDAGGTLYIAPGSSPLHHKFCVVDGLRVLSGSYNWTRAARYNQENVLVCEQGDVVAAFAQEFDALRGRSTRVTDLPALLAAVPPATESEPRQGAADAAGGHLLPEADAYERLVVEAQEAYFHQRYAEAEALLQQALVLEPDRAEAYQVLAGVYWRNEQFGSCASLVQQAEGRGVHTPNLWNLGGLGCHGLRQYKEAVGYFDRSIAAEPTNPIWYLNKCTTLDAWGRKESGNKAASDGRQVASAQIQRYKDGSDDERLLKAYLVHANLRDRPSERQQDARAAKDVYNRMPPGERDEHDLEEITSLLQ